MTRDRLIAELKKLPPDDPGGQFASAAPAIADALESAVRAVLPGGQQKKNLEPLLAGQRASTGHFAGVKMRLSARKMGARVAFLRMLRKKLGEGR